MLPEEDEEVRQTCYYRETRKSHKHVTTGRRGSHTNMLLEEDEEVTQTCYYRETRKSHKHVTTGR